jgi:myo-inositol-1(or 4)-monophosphatase
MKELLETAEAAARKAGRHIMKSMSNLGRVDEKGRADLVTNVDRGSEDIIIGEIRKKHPDHAILAEESGENSSTGSFRWVIDPIDGTTNFVHGYPFFCVSIAVQKKGDTVAAVVFDPFHDEMFSAIQGRGAFLNQEEVYVSLTPDLSGSLLATGFPYRTGEQWHYNMSLFKEFYSRTHGVRRDGAAALDLCYVAAGRFDGFWEYDLNPWDVAAGLLIVQEAGGRTTDFLGKTSSIHDKQILATNGKIHQAMLEVIRSSVD